MMSHAAEVTDSAEESKQAKLVVVGRSLIEFRVAIPKLATQIFNRRLLGIV